MRFSYAFALLLVVIFGSTAWYQQGAQLCPLPVAYRLGTLDESFGLSAADARIAIDQAVAIWQAADPAVPYFVYDDSADLVVNFVFDDRQATANAQQRAVLALDAARSENDALRQSVAQMQRTFETLQTDFTNRQAVYVQDLAAYNEQVRQVNDRGGATPAELPELANIEQSLQAEAGNLRALAAEVNSLGAELNRLSRLGNELIEAYNADVSAYNREYTGGELFTQGDYTGDEINIYKFSNQAELVSVLAHELGHALGINHVDQEGSLMHFLLEEGMTDVVQLSVADRAALAATCDVASWQWRVRSWVRSVF